MAKKQQTSHKHKKTKMTVFYKSQRIVQCPPITINDTNVENS